MLFIEMLFSNPRQFASIALIVIFSICAHEFMHAYIALKCGDPTAADTGHLTMNPLKQMGLRSLIIFCLIGIAWGQVPVNPHNLHSAKKRIAVALAGVAANFSLAVIFTVLAAILVVNDQSGQETFALQILLYGAAMNLVLLVINLFPVPGFDGWHILVEFWRPHFSSEFINGSFFIMVMLLFFGIKYIFSGSSFLIINFLKFLLRVIS